MLLIGGNTWNTRAADPVPEPSSLGDVARIAYTSQHEINNFSALQSAIDAAHDERIDRISKAGGPTLEHPARAEIDAEIMEAVRGKATTRGLSPANYSYADIIDAQYERFERRLSDLANQRPELAAIADAARPPRAVVGQRLAGIEQRQAEIMAGRGHVQLGQVPPFLSPAASFLWNAVRDPAGSAAMIGGSLAGRWDSIPDLAAMMVGGAGNQAKSIVWNASRQAAWNMVSQAGLEAHVQGWRARAGLEAGWRQASENILMAGVGGFAIDATGRSIARGVKAARGVEGMGGVFKDAPGAPEAPRVKPSIDDFDAAARAMPEDSPVRRASEGATDALRQLAEETGATQQPDVRGALQHLEARADLDRSVDEIRAAGATEADAIWTLAEAIRHAGDPDGEVPPARPPDAVARARGPDLSDDAAPAIRPGETVTVEGRPVGRARIEAGDIGVDPETFQFKGGGDAAGATDRLSGVARWDPLSAGRVVIYERANGEPIIADGHQRLSLAKRLERDGKASGVELDAYVFREVDGWRPEDVRALAAKKNLAEGSGTAIDAAKILRERPDIVDDGMPLQSGLLRQARSLARLSDEAFAQVVAGVAEPAHASLVADLVADRARHAGLLSELTALDPANQTQARLMLGELLSAPIAEHVQLDLLGVSTATRTLLAERVKVLEATIKALRKDARLFSGLVDNEGRIEAAGNDLAGDVNVARAEQSAQTAALIEELARNRGPVSAMLDDAARDVAAGAPLKRAADRFAGDVRAAFDRGGLRALLAEESHASRSGPEWSDPHGEAARDQVDALAAVAAERAKVEPPDGQHDMFSDLHVEAMREVERAKAEADAGELVANCKLF